MAVQNSLQKATQQRRLGMTAYLNQDAVKQQINSIVGSKRGTAFITSIVSAVQATPALQECTNPSILSAALLGESLNLSNSPSLGQFWIIPFNNSKKGVKEAQFQLGANGFKQLAMRTGQYKDIDFLEIHEGEYKGRDKYTGKQVFEFIEDDDEREALPVIGYMAWDAVGSTIGNSLSTIIATAHSFIKTVDVKAMAAGIATAINNALKTTDFEALGDTIGTAIGNLAGSIATFLKTVDWSKVAKAVLDTLKGVFKGITEDSDNMKAIGAIVATLIGAAIAKQAVANLFTSAATKIISAISGGLEGSTSWASLGSTVMSKLSTNLTSKVSTLLNDQVFLAKFASIGTTIATCVGTAIAGFELGKNLGSYLFPEDADYYDNFKWSDFFSKFNKEDAKGAWKEFITEITGGETKGHKAEIDFTANEDSIRGVNKKVNDGLKTSDVAAGAGKILDVGIQTTPDTAKIASARATIANGFTGKNQVSASIKSAVDTGSANTAKQNIVKSFANVSTSIRINKATNLKKVKSDIRSSMKKTNASFKVQADTNSIKQAKSAIQDGLQGISITATGKITWESGQTSQIAVDKNGKHHTIYKAMGGILGSSGWLPITRYATGGLPKSAEMFMAREAGPELVGRIGSRTAVVNNDQIVASVSEGVYRAVVAALGSGGNQQAINLALRLIMDGKQTTQIVIDRINEMIDTTGQIPIRI